MKIRTIYVIGSLLLTGAALLFTGGCKKNENPAAAFVPSTVSDQDGNIYHVIHIGSQWWTLENLRTTTYNDGTPIANLIGYSAWANATSGGYCSYYGTTDSIDIATFGLLYNWYAVNTGKLAPAGWHVSTDADWSVLVNYAGGDSLAGGQLKEAGYAHWITPNTGATNASGFTALPCGDRNIDGSFGGRGNRGFWWAVLDDGTNVTWNRYMTPDDTRVYRDHYYKTNGFSVRCVKNR